MRDSYRLKGTVDDERLRRFYALMDPEQWTVGGSITPRWMSDGCSFWYAERTRDHTILQRVDGKSGKVAPLLDVQRVREALRGCLGRALPGTGLPFDEIIELDAGRYRFAIEGKNYDLFTKDYRLEPAVTVARAPRLFQRPIWLMEPMVVPEVPSPDGAWLASLAHGNIVLRSSADDRVTELTSDGTPDFAWDIEAQRSRLSSGLTSKPRRLNPWSPDSHRLFAIKFDRRNVPDLPFVRYLKRDEEACAIKTQRAGGAIDIAHPHIIDVLARRARRLDLGETEDYYFTLIGWLPDGSEVLFTRHARDFKSVDVLAASAATGRIRVVLSERSSTFVAIQHDVIFGGDTHATLLPDGSGLIWRSSRSGWDQLYLYAIDGTALGALTEGEFAVEDIVSVDQRRGWVYFTAHHDQKRPYDTHLCRVKLTDGEIHRLTSFDGQNIIHVSPSCDYFLAINSRPDRPPRTDLYTADGKHVALIQKADVTRLEASGYLAPEEFSVLAADGSTTLWGVMYKPANFDPRKKYPVIDHIYGGPQVTMVNRHFGPGEGSQKRLDHALTQLGYIVISIDARGTPERSKAFHDVVYRNWGRNEIPDHAAALRQLAQRHAFIDLGRVGIWGHSWGGYFTVRALAQAPDVFHVGVASALGADPYDAIIYEPYLDLPTRSRDAYEYAKLYPWVSRIKGRLMMVAGTCDPMVYSNTIELVHYLIAAAIDHELVVLPEAGHGFQGNSETYFIHKLVSHFERHLRSRSAPAAAMTSQPSTLREDVENAT